MKGTEFLVNAVVAEGIDHIFMVPGGLIDAFYPTLCATEGVRAITRDNTRGAAVLSWQLAGSYSQDGIPVLVVADQVALDIIKSNINTRPIYFSVTVPTANRIGTTGHLIGEGLALRVTPDLQPQSDSPLEDPLDVKSVAAVLEAEREVFKVDKNGQ